jgi:hypothetical protein
MRDAPSSNLGLLHPQIVVPLLFHKILALDGVITQSVGEFLGHDAGLRVGAVVGQPGDRYYRLGLPGHGLFACSSTLLVAGPTLLVVQRAVNLGEHLVDDVWRSCALEAAPCPSVVQRAAQMRAQMRALLDGLKTL